ncbi:MAG: hypothetical protein K2M16_03185 [Muribaculaceae bacterium]|nr:hypothetical protein [Muribaculaceae bacterium]
MTANEALFEYYSSIPKKERSKLTLELMIQLEVTYYTVHNWRYSNSRIKPLFRREISRIIGKDIFADVTD